MFNHEDRQPDLYCFGLGPYRTLLKSYGYIYTARGGA
jgi:hypothetical protein